MKKTKRIMKRSIGNLIAMLAISIFCVCLLGGCGSSDPFSGHWIGVGEKSGVWSNPECYYDVTIEKNGNGNNYLVNVTKGFWDKHVDVDLRNNSRHVTQEWQENKENQRSAVRNDKTLNVQTPEDPMVHEFFTTVEKDGTLQLNLGEGDVITLHKAKEGEATELKEQFKDKIQKESNSHDITWKDKN